MANPHYTFENCKLAYKNFSGRDKDTGKLDETKKEFTILIDEDTVMYDPDVKDAPIFKGTEAIVPVLQNLVAWDKQGNRYDMGANVKARVDPNGDIQYTMKVKVGWAYEPKNFYKVVDGQYKQRLTLATVGSLDKLSIEYVNFSTTFSGYSKNGNRGISNYISDFVAVVKEDIFMKSFGMLPDFEDYVSASNAGATILNNGYNFEEIPHAEDDCPF